MTKLYMVRDEGGELVFFSERPVFKISEVDKETANLYGWYTARPTWCGPEDEAADLTSVCVDGFKRAFNLSRLPITKRQANTKIVEVTITLKGL